MDVLRDKEKIQIFIIDDGEGIFFTSRMFDEFEIESKGLNYSHNTEYSFDYTEDARGIETSQFNKTVIPVKLAQFGNEKLLSRSQAKRLLMHVEKFENAIFDFKDVNSIGQAFADEIFRVYANKNVNITLLPLNMTVDVEMMVNRALGK